MMIAIVKISPERTTTRDVTWQMREAWRELGFYYQWR